VLELSSDAQGLIADLDLADFEGRRAMPVDYERGKRSPAQRGAAQVAAGAAGRAPGAVLFPAR
jgi:hypothetical protein